MAENEVQAGTTTDKHDDFFDEPPKQNVILTPEPPKENGEVESEPPKQNGDVTPVPQETADSAANDEGDKAGDEDASAAVAVNGEQAKDDEQNDGAADSEAGGVQTEAADVEGEEKSAEVAAEEDKPNGVEQTNGEEFEQDAITSHPSSPTVQQTPEADGNIADDEQAEEDKQEQEPTLTETKNEEESSLPEVEVGGPEREDEPQQSLAEQEERRTPSGGEDNYDDSFSDDTSLKNGTEGEAVIVVTTETNEPEVQAPVAGEGETEREGDTGEPGTTDPPRTPVSPSPSDSRAEAGVVVPVEAVTDDTKITDGRSSPTADDQGELFRGEDRKEEPAPEGSEDCRGQGQWKSEEQQYIASAILVEKSDKEALDEAVKEKERLHDEYSEVKARLAMMEEEILKRDDRMAVDKELLAKRDKELSELREQLVNLKSNSLSEEEVEYRVKDLQERLAILARENEQKDKRISKLEQDLVDVTDKLRETERKLFATEKLNQQHQEAPKSKTCAIM